MAGIRSLPRVNAAGSRLVFREAPPPEGGGLSQFVFSARRAADFQSAGALGTPRL